MDQFGRQKPMDAYGNEDQGITGSSRNSDGVCVPIFPWDDCHVFVPDDDGNWNIENWGSCASLWPNQCKQCLWGCNWVEAEPEPLPGCHLSCEVWNNESILIDSNYGVCFYNDCSSYEEGQFEYWMTHFGQNPNHHPHSGLDCGGEGSYCYCQAGTFRKELIYHGSHFPDYNVQCPSGGPCTCPNILPEGNRDWFKTGGKITRPTGRR